jgi:hypothetical protein
MADFERRRAQQYRVPTARADSSNTVDEALAGPAIVKMIALLEEYKPPKKTLRSALWQTEKSCSDEVKLAMAELSDRGKSTSDKMEYICLLYLGIGEQDRIPSYMKQCAKKALTPYFSSETGIKKGIEKNFAGVVEIHNSRVRARQEERDQQSKYEQRVADRDLFNGLGF